MFTNLQNVLKFGNMDITKIDELWLELDKISQKGNTIVAISNTGKYRRRNGKVGTLSLRQRSSIIDSRGVRERYYVLIAKHFLITVKRPDQVQIDHITHSPTEYEVNDVRNLRFCNQVENMNFDEAKSNRSGENHPLYGKTGNMISWWKGDNVGPSGAYKRARKLYKVGEITEEEFQQYRDALKEFRRNKKSTS